MKNHNQDNQSYYNKSFYGTLTSVCRRDLESLPYPFDTSDVSDDTMQEIINAVDAEIELYLEPEERFDFENDDHYQVWHKKIEEECRYRNIPTFNIV